MSHYTTLIVVNQAEDASHAERQAEEMLAPFDENTSVEPHREYETGGPHEFWANDILIKDGFLDEGSVTWPAILQGLRAKYGPYDGEISRYGIDDLGMYRITTYNPKSQWDWYALGGRWSGFFMIKAAVDAQARLGEVSWTRKDDPPEVGTADLVQKRDIDFEIMRRESEIKAEERWRSWTDLLSHLTEQERADYLPWSLVRDNHGLDDIETARKVYGEQALVKLLRKREWADRLGWDVSPVEDFYFDEPDAHERFIRANVDRTAVPWAVLDSEGWHEKGRMGWFGMSDDKYRQEDWNRMVQEMYDGLDDEAWLLLYDLHI